MIGTDGQGPGFSQLSDFLFVAFFLWGGKGEMNDELQREDLGDFFCSPPV